jgi:hypothetical protein
MVVPLDTILEVLRDRKQVIDWLDFVQTALEHGWSLLTTLKKIEYNLSDVYGKEYAKEINERIKQGLMEQGYLSL